MVTYQLLFCSDVHAIEKNLEALLLAYKKMDVVENAEILSTWSCLEIRMQEGVTI
jgi:hypothetical protein